MEILNYYQISNIKFPSRLKILAEIKRTIFWWIYVYPSTWMYKYTNIHEQVFPKDYLVRENML